MLICDFFSLCHCTISLPSTFLNELWSYIKRIYVFLINIFAYSRIYVTVIIAIFQTFSWFLQLIIILWGYTLDNDIFYQLSWTISARTIIMNPDLCLKKYILSKIMFRKINALLKQNSNVIIVSHLFSLELEFSRDHVVHYHEKKVFCMYIIVIFVL